MKKNLNDFIIEILQEFNEIQSMAKVLKDSVHNENSEIVMADVDNVLEILIAKLESTKNSLNKYIDFTFL